MYAKYGINNIGTYQEEVGEEIYLEVDDGKGYIYKYLHYLPLVGH